MIRIHELYKSYDGVQALRGLSLQIKRGELFGLIGVNGAGKSTLLKILIGLLKPDSGHVTVADMDISTEPVRVKKMIGYVPEELILYDYLTGFEFLEFVARLRGIKGDIVDKKIRNLLADFSITDKANELIADYSHGMKQKISLCAAMLGEPEILLLDEPTNGLDAESAIRFKQRLREMCDAGVTVVFSSHILDTVEKISNRIGIIHHGQIVACDTMENLRKVVGPGKSLEDIFISLIHSKPSD